MSFPGGRDLLAAEGRGLGLLGHVLLSLASGVRVRALAALLYGGLAVRTKSCSGDIAALGWLLRPELAQQERLLALRPRHKSIALLLVS